MLGQFSSIAHSDQRYCATATISIDEGGGASRGVLVVVPKVGVSAAIGGADGVSSTAVSGGDNLVTVLALTLYANASESTPQSKFISRVRGRNGQSLRPERSYPCCLGNSDIAIPPTSRLLLQSESPFEGLVTKEEEKRGVAAVPGGVIASLGTTVIFVFVVIFVIVVSGVVIGSVVVVGGVDPNATPPVLSSPLQVGKIGMNDDLVIHAGRRWRVWPPLPLTLSPSPLPSL